MEVNQEASNNLSYTQYALICVSCWAGCFLSCLGSTIILYCARSKLSNLYHRTLSILSIFDIINSLTWALHPVFFNARDTPGLYWARGNLQSCAAGGFLAVGFALPMWMYSAFLSVYFLLVIRYRWPDRMIATYLEKPAFFLSILVSFSGATVGVVTQSFNPRPNDLLCLSQGYPYQCELNDDVVCTRGGYSANAGLMIVSVAAVSGFCGLVCTCSIYGTVWVDARKHRLSSRYALSTSLDRRLRSVATQSFLYLLVYLNVLIWPIGTNIIFGVTTTTATTTAGSSTIEDRTSLGPFLYSLISWFFFPITGFFNCMVYLRPRYAQWRTCHPQEGRWWAIMKAIGPDSVPMSEISRRQIIIMAQQQTAAVEHQELEEVSQAVELYESRELSHLMLEMRCNTSRTTRARASENSKELPFDEEDEDDDKEDTICDKPRDDGRRILDWHGTKTETEETFDNIVG